jgi:spermidine/putrescine transport system permease protein
VGTLTALGFRKSPVTTRAWVEPTLTLPLVLPEIALGLSFLIGFVQVGWPLGWSSLFAAHFGFTFVYAALIMRSRLESLDVSLFDAARDLGANSWATLRHALWPQIVPGFSAAFLTCFALSFDDFLISFFTKGVDQNTLPIQIYSMMKIRLREEIYALSSVLFCLSFFVVLGTQGWLRKKQKSWALPGSAPRH